MEDPSRPLYSKTIYVGWLLDVQWDPYGHGVYTVGSDFPVVSAHIKRAVKGREEGEGWHH